MLLYQKFIALLVLLAVSSPTVVSISPIDLDGDVSLIEFGLLKYSNEIDAGELVIKEDLGDLDTVVARFFPDESELTFVRKKAALNSWYGETEEGIGMANFNRINGRLTGSATFNETVYQIFTSPSSGEAGRAAPTIKASRLTIGDFPQDDEPKCLSECFDDSAEDTAAAADNSTELDTIDTMIVYTYRAMCGEAGLEYPCDITPENKAPIEDRAALAVEEANTAYELSGITGRQVLMHVAMVDETYDDSMSTFDQILNDLSGTTDGLIDEVHEWRKTYGADLVSLFVENGSSCGLAWLYDKTPEAGFSVVCRDCSTGYYSYVHEQGHNTGSHHDEASCQGATAKFSFGFQDPQDRFRTIMSYDCMGKSCIRIQRFSSPILTYQGESLGSEAADNGKWC